MRKELITQRSPKSIIAEMFKTLRTNLQFMSSNKNIKTILVTSTMPGEGKTWVSSNMAITFAQTGKKVLLIDADMRKGRLASLFQVDSKPGLSNFLSGIDQDGFNKKIDITKYIKPTEIENLFIIPAGNIPPNPSELLETETTVRMLEKLEKIFDIIILDGTPCLLVTDSVILSRMADTTILVTSYKYTKKENLKKVKNSIEKVGGKIAGVVLNNVPVTAKEYSKSYYYVSKNGQKLPTRRQTEKRSEEKSEIQESILSQINDYLKKDEEEREEEE